MIPKFPNFKKIELADRASIDSYTNRHLPYSDFNFTNLWSWNPKAKEGRMISELNGNLVVLFTDYRTNEPSLSFLGTNKIDDTALQLLNYAKANNISPILRFIAEESAISISSPELVANEDNDNHDYIFSVSQLANPKGIKFKSKRHLANRFLRDYPEAVFKIMDFSNAETHEKIISVLRQWENKKISDNKSYELEHEEIALRRLLQTATDHKLILSGIFLNDTMIAFSLDEILPHKYAISHFLKADTTYRGIYEFLNEMVAQHLEVKGVELWNWEQDLNIEGLRRLKMSYRPVSFLKKFKVSLL